MADFTEGFLHFVPPDQETIRRGIVNGLIVLDSNVLLSAYRFAPRSREELLQVLALIGKRIWIPHQVALEFHRNRLMVIADYDAAYKGAIEAVTKRQQESVPELQQKVRELSNRVALSDEERDELLGMLALSFEKIGSSLEMLRNSHGVGKPGAPDAIYDQLNAVFKGKVGDPLASEEEKLEKEEAAVRVQKKIPPGYKDADKEESHGDYLVWCQALREAKKRSAEVLVVVTNDTKEDWYLRLKGQPIMARPELALECVEKSGARLVLLPTRLFLEYAKRYLEAHVSDETIRQAEQSQLADERRGLEVLRERFDNAMRGQASFANRAMELENQRAAVQSKLDRAAFRMAESINRVNDLKSRLAEGADDVDPLDINQAEGQLYNHSVEHAAARDELGSISYSLKIMKHHLQQANNLRLVAADELADARSRADNEYPVT